MATLAHKLEIATLSDLVLYVDDVHIITTTEQDVRRALTIVRQFVDAFALSLSTLKSCMWGSESAKLQELSDEFHIPVTQQLEALGATWQLAAKGNCTYAKERDKIATIKQRLERVVHLPSPLHLRALVISSTCLSMLDYLPPPVPKLIHELKAPIRRALKAPFGAPEIILNVVTSSSLDPFDRAVTSLLRLWAHAANDRDMREVLRSGKLTHRKGRFGFLVSVAAESGWELNADYLRIGTEPHCQQFTWANGWRALRKGIVQALKDHAYCKLQQRRPLRYEGDFMPNWKAMSKFLRRLSPVVSSTLLRIWGGVPMTGDRKFRLMGAESGACKCGAQAETLEHLMWDCPMFATQRPLHLTWWSTLPNACVQTLLCPRSESNAFVRDWQSVCAWALKALHLAFRAERQEIEAHPTTPMALLQQVANSETPFCEVKGHCVVPMVQHGYVVCMRCYVARRARDAHYLGVRHCKLAENPPACIGDYVVKQKHIARLYLDTWKRTSCRPRMQCVKCLAQQWATADFRAVCVL